jgi:protoporphyrinogen oxidase
MRIGIVGGGVLGLTLALRLAQRGHGVEVFEAEPEPGGLAGWADYGEFVWDRFYHVVAPQDRHVLGLVGELGLAAELRWTRTGTGYYAGGRMHPMTTTLDLLRFPLLSMFDKLRLGASMVYATRLADPRALHEVSAEDWLTRVCGARVYRQFWRPLLKAKFGDHHRDVAAVFIWATIRRLSEARSSRAAREQLGYVTGGYRRIIGRLCERLTQLDVRLHLASPVRRITSVSDSDGDAAQCRIDVDDSASTAGPFDLVIFTAPTRLARRVVAPELLSTVDETERRHPSGDAYLGVACQVLVLDRPLTPFYVLNIADDGIPLTGLIEMTNLIDAQTETKGRSLVYLPLYADSEDPRLAQSDDALASRLVDGGLFPLFPDLNPRAIVRRALHRARYVQALPLVRRHAPDTDVPAIRRPFQILNSSMITRATLHNDEVIRLANEYIDKNAVTLGAGRSVSPRPGGGA